MLKKIVDDILNAILTPGMEISFSKIKAYQYCPVKYKKIYVDAWRAAPTPYSSFGVSVHRALEEFHSKGFSTFEDMLECYSKSWVNEGFDSPQQAQEFYEKGETALSRYVNSNKDRKSEILFLEEEFTLAIGKNKLRGIIDRIDRRPEGSYEVIDYKTHSEIWGKEKADSDLQLTLYAFAAKEVYGLDPVVLTYHFILQDRKVSTSRSKEQIDNALALTNDIIDKINKNWFEPNVENCPSCDFRSRCQFAKLK